MIRVSTHSPALFRDAHGTPRLAPIGLLRPLATGRAFNPTDLWVWDGRDWTAVMGISRWTSQALVRAHWRGCVVDYDPERTRLVARCAPATWRDRIEILSGVSCEDATVWGNMLAIPHEYIRRKADRPASAFMPGECASSICIGTEHPGIREAWESFFARRGIRREWRHEDGMPGPTFTCYPSRPRVDLEIQQGCYWGSEPVLESRCLRSMPDALLVASATVIEAFVQAAGVTALSCQYLLHPKTDSPLAVAGYCLAWDILGSPALDCASSRDGLFSLASGNPKRDKNAKAVTAPLIEQSGRDILSVEACVDVETVSGYLATGWPLAVVG